MGQEKKLKPILTIRDQAIIDVDEAGIWYDKKRKGLSLDFELCVEAGFEDILLEPEGYQFKYRDLVRVRYIKRFPYGIHYLLEEKQGQIEIIVIAVFHVRKNPSSWTDRLNEF